MKPWIIDLGADRVSRVLVDTSWMRVKAMKAERRGGGAANTNADAPATRNTRGR